MTPLLLIGAGGHAKVVWETALASGQWSIVGAVESEPSRSEFRGIRVYDERNGFASSVGAKAFHVAIGHTGKAQVRIDLFETARSSGLEPATIIHPSAVLSRDIKIGGGTLIASSVTIHPDAQVGENVILNTRCIIEHDCVVGDHAHIAPGATLLGGVNVGAGALVGAGAVVLPGLTVGPNAIVGAGAVVTQNVPADYVVRGIPAR